MRMCMRMRMRVLAAAAQLLYVWGVVVVRTYVCSHLPSPRAHHLDLHALVHFGCGWLPQLGCTPPFEWVAWLRW